MEYEVRRKIQRCDSTFSQNLPQVPCPIGWSIWRRTCPSGLCSAYEASFRFMQKNPADRRKLIAAYEGPAGPSQFEYLIREKNNRVHPTRRSRSKLLRKSTRHQNDRTGLTNPPQNPGLDRNPFRLLGIAEAKIGRPRMNHFPLFARVGQLVGRHSQVRESSFQ